MKISIKVKPNAKEERVEKTGENSFSVWVKEKPQEGRANEALIRAVAEYFNISQSAVSLIKGGLSRNKILEVRI